jgi:trk system potassium uptake protein TrkA
MHIVIVGAGRTGTQLAKHLVREKHDVSLIESNEERARHASNRIDCLVLHDEGNSLASLEEAGIAKAHALVCVTDSDEVNMIICGLAASRYPALLKIARVRNDDYVRLNRPAEKSKSFEDPKILGIDHFIHPDVEAARVILSSLSHRALGNVIELAGTSYELGSVDVVEGSEFDGLCLKDYRSLIKEESLIAMIEREAETGRECILPTGSTVLAKGDRVHIIAQESEIENIFSLAGRTEKPLNRIGIVGGGRISTLIAEGILSPVQANQAAHEKKKHGHFSVFRFLLPKSLRQVVIVEQNYEICKDLSARFPDALVLNEDISDESFIAEESLGNLDLIITATANQELNMITAIYLKSRGVKRAISLVNSSGYETIARQLGVDVVIPIQSVVADSILSKLKGKGIHGVHRLGDGKQEILEAEIVHEAPAAGKPISEFKLSEGGLIILVNRGDASFIPRGDYIFEGGDKIILIAKNGSEGELEKFFAPVKEAAANTNGATEKP